jgi:hypothetical protein
VCLRETFSAPVRTLREDEPQPPGLRAALEVIHREPPGVALLDLGQQGERVVRCDQHQPSARSSGSQSLALAPSQGGFVELSFPEAGQYPFLSHSMIDAERGAHGIINVIG